MKFSDERETYWSQDFDAFERADYVRFSTTHLLPVLRAQHADTVKEAGERQLTVNVRRGDYYSDPKWRPLYGFDVAGYVRAAVDQAQQQGAVERIQVVSDGIDWCQQNLTLLTDVAPVEWVGTTTALDHLALLSSARRLILANSSFSYWAAYISNARYGDNHRQIIAPDFHRRDIFDGRTWQLDPTWTIIRDIPGGWDEKSDNSLV